MAVTPVKAEFDFLTAECNKYTGIDGKEVAVHGLLLLLTAMVILVV